MLPCIYLKCIVILNLKSYYKTGCYEDQLVIVTFVH